MKNDDLAFAYDDAFRLLVARCDEMLLPFINYMFDEHYDNSAKIIRGANEHMSDDGHGDAKKRITDSVIEIVADNISKFYHIECESRYDGSILVRIFEYDARIALESGRQTKSRLDVYFPHTGILFLSSPQNAAEEMQIVLHTTGGEVSYPVKVIHEHNFTMDKLFEEKLYFLIPFYLFNYRSKLKRINEDSEALAKLTAEYEKVLEKLDELVENDELSALSRGVIISVTERVMMKLAKRHENILKEVGGLMGGKIMHLEFLDKWDAAEARGEAKGEAKRKELEEENVRLKEEIERLRAAIG